MDLVDKIISEDRKRKYSNALVVKILLIIQIYGYPTDIRRNSSKIIKI